MRIVLTGAGGFIGSALAPLLQSHRLLIVDVKDPGYAGENISFVQGDLTGDGGWRKAVESFSPDALIHLAWLGLPDYSAENNRLNYDLSIRLFETAIRAGCKKMFCAGTCWEYGGREGRLKEDVQPIGVNPFALTKTALREAGESMAKENGIDFSWGRIFFVYGPGQRSTSLIPSSYRAIKEGRRPAIKNYFSLCDFIHVRDVASAIKALVETDGISGVFNFGSGSPVEAGEVSRLVAVALGQERLAPDRPSSGQPSGFWADNGLLISKTGWKPEIALPDGVRRTLRSLEEAGV